MAEKKASTPKRYRNFATIVYPESAPVDWQEILSSYHVPAFVSPLHDKDTLPDGTKKKPHYHVMLMYEGVKTHDQVSEVVKSLGGVGIEILGSISGYARYLCHLDEIGKVHYDPNDVLSFAGADYLHITTLPSDRYKMLNDMIEYIEKNNVLSFSEFVNYCRESKFEWFRLLCDNSTYFIDRHIKAKSWMKDQSKAKASK